VRSERIPVDIKTAPRVVRHPEARSTRSDQVPTTESIAQTAHPKGLCPSTTRFERGIVLAQEHFEEITRVVPWIWSVPSESGVGIYVVNLKSGECSCPDRTPEGETDKHVVAARYVKAKTATCSGCKKRFRHRDLVEVQEDHESLTWFPGQLLCEGCAGDTGVL
jgi:hypothetical protein